MKKFHIEKINILGKSTIECYDEKNIKKSIFLDPDGLEIYFYSESDWRLEFAEDYDDESVDKIIETLKTMGILDDKEGFDLLRHIEENVFRHVEQEGEIEKKV